MKFLTIPVSILAFVLPMVTGLVTKKIGVWFYVGVPIVIIAGFLLVCLPALSLRRKKKIVPVENEEIFDHLFIAKARNYVGAGSLKRSQAQVTVIF